MDAQNLINLGVGGALSVIGWLAKTLWDAVNDLKSSLHNLEIELPTNYVSKMDYSETMKRIEALIARIADKLDEKVDKP